MKMIVTMSGVPSSGKSTIARRLADRLGWQRMSMGDVFKEMAQKEGKGLNEFYRELGNDPKRERECDLRQKEWGMMYDNFILDARIAFHFMPEEKSYNLFFDLPKEEAAKRAYQRGLEGKGEVFDSIDNAQLSIEQRMKNETDRYKDLYGINHLNKENYDYIVDANRTIDAVFKDVYNNVLEELKRRKELR